MSGTEQTLRVTVEHTGRTRASGTQAGDLTYRVIYADGRSMVPAPTGRELKAIGLSVPPDPTPDVLRRPSTHPRAGEVRPSLALLDGPHCRVDAVYARDLTAGDYLPSPHNNDEFLRVTAVNLNWRTGAVYYEVATIEAGCECLAWDPIYVLKEDLK